jgi:hypothetical protein
MNNSQCSRLDRRLNLFVLVLAGALVLMVLAFSGANGHSKLTTRASAAGFDLNGEWTADVRNASGNDIQITFMSGSSKGSYSNSMGRTMKISDFQGLNIADVTSAAKTAVKFSLVREPGTFDCEGSFTQGLGAGFWKFTPNQSFVSAMRGRGYDKLTDEDLMRAAFHNLTSKYIDELKTAGFSRVTFDDLSRAAGHEITVAYINELRSAGYNSVTMDDIIRAHNHEIDTAYLNQMREMGFEKQTLDDVIRARNHQIDPGFIAEMRSAGFSDLSLDDVIRLKNHQISANYVSELKAEGIANVSADDVIRAKNHEITVDLIRRAKAQGYANVGLDELIRLNNRGLIK